MKILVVDDKPAIVGIVTELLKDIGCSVESAANGLDAFEKAQKATFDLYVIDHLMPVMDGLKLVKNLKKKPWTSTTPIIFMTTQNVSTLEHLEEYSLFDKLISKPIDKNVFYCAINQLVPQNTLVHSL